MKSQELFNESKKFLPGGVDSPVRAYKPYPFFAERAEGSKIMDVDGNSYIDYCLAYGPMVLGHANQDIMKEVVKQLKNGSAYAGAAVLILATNNAAKLLMNLSEK